MSIASMLANSVRFALPRITAPASRSSLTRVASPLARAPSSASEPAVVGCLSPVAMLSFTKIGTPASGCSTDGLALSSFAAIVSASAIELAYRVELGPVAVVSLDAREVAFGQRRSGDPPAGQRLDDIAHRRALECQRGLRLGAGGGNGAYGGRGEEGIAAGWLLHGVPLEGAVNKTGMARFCLARP